MTGEAIRETLKKYNLQSWSVQSKINPIPVERGEASISGIRTGSGTPTCPPSW